MNYLPLRTTWLHTAILFVLLLVGCTPIRPASDAGTSPQVDRDAVLTWEGAPLSDNTACGRLLIDGKGQVTFGPCGETGQTQPLGVHAEEWAGMQTRFAAFAYTTDATTLAFNGTGEIAGEPWQRAVTAWAQLVYSELSAGRASTTGATAMRWIVGAAADDATLCQQVTVLRYGYAYAQTAPCAGGNVQESTGGWLNDAEWAQIDAWQQAYAPIYVENNYVNGIGTQTAGEPEAEQIAAWAQAVYERLQTASENTGAWQRYQADSGYHIDYPLALYSLRAGQSGPTVLFPGVRVVEPNDAFTYQDRNQAVYKLSIAVTANEQELSLDQPEALLANRALIAYDPALLADYTIQPIELGGVPALRVDDLPVGPAGITTQIVALHGDLIYELLVEPHVLTTNQAEPYVAGTASAANRTLIEQVIGTFGFTE